MCGIVGYLGPRDTKEVLLSSLKRLEYRGYDSAGVALFVNGSVQVFRKQGKVKDLEPILLSLPVSGRLGIGHTRWATHGKPSDRNAHPHRAGSIVLVHNGIIENHAILRKELIRRGRKLLSDTDTEIIAHLIDEAKNEGCSELLRAVAKALKKIEGTYAIAVLDETQPELLVGARLGSPLVLGVGEGEFFLASDTPAILPYTRKVVFLEDGDLVEIRRNSYRIVDLELEPRERPLHTIDWDPQVAEKGGFRHYMLKEIYEQPQAIQQSLLGRFHLEKRKINFSELGIAPALLEGIRRIHFVACGTSWHASLIGKYLVERYLKIPAGAEVASEFRYRDPVLTPDTLVVAVSQSGETADTIAAVHIARQREIATIAICNVLGSTLSRLTDGVIYTRAGPEISVASTKAFVTQIATILLLILAYDDVHHRIPSEVRERWIRDLLRAGNVLEEVLKKDPEIESLARHFINSKSMLYLGRGLGYPLALEGALKMKEISYIHAEAYPAGEMKHGPIALVDPDLPVVFLLLQDELKEKLLSNMEELRSREGKVILFMCGEDSHARELAHHAIQFPSLGLINDLLTLTLPLQLFAYHVARFRGTDVDQPRNLAKSVTVE
jgi:glucosamine--fructose-6-phosphate aminotransferase (isomerizing)